MKRTDLRKRFGQKILLEPGGQPKLLVEAVHVKVEGLIAAAHEVDLFAELIQLRAERFHLGQGRIFDFGLGILVG
jgi:hypothetical protein